MSRHEDALVEVGVYGLPVTVWAGAQESIDGLLREFALIVSGAEHGLDGSVPRQLLELIRELQHEYSGVGNDQNSRLAQAAGDGTRYLDLIYRVPAEVAGACERLSQTLDEADRFCLDGEHLLSLATPAGPLAFRRWFLGEFIAQIGGRPPTCWADWVAAHG